MTLAAGSRIGCYQIESALGAGGMAEVYRARDTKLGRAVAIKALPTAFATNPERLARFRREAHTLASLNHPNIAAIYGLEESTEGPYLLLELVEGETLAARLVGGKLALSEAIDIGVQVATAIEAAHERGIVHRDLKPGNIMITRLGVAKVLDFGLAKTDAGLGTDPDMPTQTVAANAWATSTGIILGTAPYMSPEQARGLAVDRRSDVWSFGCVMFECVTGRAAFAGDTVSDLFARILERDPDWTLLPGGTPPRVRELLRRCLLKDPNVRPRDIRDVRVELVDIASGRGKAASPEKSIAVLPFENLSGAGDEYFADGVTDEIMNALSHLEGLRVAARTSCFAFKGKREDLRAVGEKLDVKTVLEGTVRRSGVQLRISVQLVNAADGYQLWSERYDREMTDVFQVQDEIARAIAVRLRVALHDESERGRARAGTENLEAYELLLKGRSLQNKRGRFLLEAVSCFERAIALDPNYAEAMAWVSDSYRLMGFFGAAPLSQAMPKAKSMAESALTIDPGLAEAWATIASVEEQYEWNFDRADTIWDRTLAVDPRHARARSQRAFWSFVRGASSIDEALNEARRSMQEDPLNSWICTMHSFILGVAGMHEESIAEGERALALEADSFFAHWNVIRSYAWAGQFDRAIKLGPGLVVVSGRDPWALGALAWVYGKVGQEEHARAVYDELEARSRHGVMSSFWLSVAAASGGLVDRSLEHVERAMVDHDPLVVWSRKRVVPFWDTISGQPRFEELMRRVSQ